MAMAMAMLLQKPTGKHETKTSKPIPQFSMRGYIMRRKWKKANVNSTSSSPVLLSSSPPLLLMISILLLSTVSLCAGREIRGTVANRNRNYNNVSGSRTFYDSSSNATSNNNHGEDNKNESSSEFTWTVERKECGQLDEGCFCGTRSRNMTSVICRCENDTQVAHIQAPGQGSNIRPSSLFVQKERWTWRFEKCSKIILHSEFLGTVDGSHFQVEFFNISTFDIQESAFATRDTYASHDNEVSIHFDQCGIDSLPTKTFPSYVSNIKFTRCTISALTHRFIYTLNMGKVEFESCKIDNIDSEAFYNQTIIDTLKIEDSTVSSISRHGVASAINQMVWINSEVQLLQRDALSGSVANVTIHNSQFAKVESNGFAVKTWNKIILSNNTFSDVERRGIDLTHFSEDPSVEIIGNSWGRVDRDFIATGTSEYPFISVSSNTFSSQCECGNTFVSYLTTNGSRTWFHQELYNNSRCPVSDQVIGCLVLNDHINSTESNLLQYEQLSLLCEPKVYMCLNDVSDVGIGTTDETGIPGRPQLPNRLRVLAYFIAAMGIFIIASLLITMCVFLCRRKNPKKKTPPESPLQNMEHAQGKKTGMPKSMSGGEYADIVFKHNNATSASRPRSMLLEDVEMEDKGVQTMPTELSSEVLEGLREKLSRPDSFWDAKETIDHLYDLIQVKELNSSSGLSSPPDVTMCNGNGQSTTASTARLLPSTSSSPVAQITSAGVSVSIGGSDPNIIQKSSITTSNASSPTSDTPPPLPATSPPKNGGVPLLQRYAQIRNSKAKTAPLCEYADPSDSSMHIYSELTPQTPNTKGSDGNANKKSPSHSINDNKKLASPRESPSHKNSFLSATRRPPINGPIICEYTEPKDVQTHVYAELSTNPTSSSSKSQPSSASGSPVKVANQSSLKSTGTSPYKQPVNHVNTITIAVPPPPITIPHSNSFHNSPRHLAKIKENELSSSNPSITTTSPVNIVHLNHTDSSTTENKTSSHQGGRRRWPSEKLKRSQSSADNGARSSTSVSSLFKLRGENGKSNGERGTCSSTGSCDTQKRPLPSIPSWPNKNEAKSQF